MAHVRLRARWCSLRTAGTELRPAVPLDKLLFKRHRIHGIIEYFDRNI